MIARLAAKIKWILFWILPGFLLWASFPPMAETTDVFFALAPALFFARHNSPRRSFLCWFVNGLFFWTVTLSWMPAIVKNGGPWPLVVLGWGALAAYCALYFGAFGWLSSHVWRLARARGYRWRLFAIFVAEPVLWAGLEIVRSRLGGGFAWNQLGVAPVNAAIGAPAALGGVYLVSALVILINGTFASVADRILAPRLKDEAATDAPPKWARSVETLIPVLLVLGVYKAANPAARPSGGEGTEEIKIGLVQRNMPSVFEVLSGKEEDPVERYGFLFSTLKYMKPDLVVLSESALAEVGPVDSARARSFALWALKESGARALLSGGSRAEGGRLYNSAAVFTEDGLGDVYDKVHLVPFGEFIPGDKTFPVLQRLAPVGSCTPGELRLMRAGGAALGVAICYEDTDSAQMRSLARMGARALVLITNDNWFSDSVEPLQHAWQAVARAVETGLPVIRVGNSGVTGIVTPDGGVSWLSGADGKPLVDKAGATCVRVALPRAGAGVYLALGDAPIFSAFLILLIAMGMIKYKAHYEQRRKVSL